MCAMTGSGSIIAEGSFSSCSWWLHCSVAKELITLMLMINKVESWRVCYVRRKSVGVTIQILQIQNIKQQAI